MKATLLNGIVIEGTPAEIQAYLGAVSAPKVQSKPKAAPKAKGKPRVNYGVQLRWALAHLKAGKDISEHDAKLKSAPLEIKQKWAAAKAKKKPKRG